jgi:hypothetical protein
MTARLSKVKRKSKLKRPRPSNPNSIVIDDSLTLGRNRRSYEFGQIVHEQEEDVSDYVKIRLLVARMKALEVYKKAHT